MYDTAHYIQSFFFFLGKTYLIKPFSILELVSINELLTLPLNGLYKAIHIPLVATIA